MDQRLQEGKFFLETVWYIIAEKVVERAIQIYELDEEAASALKEVFLRPNLYTVQLI